MKMRMSLVTVTILVGSGLTIWFIGWTVAVQANPAAISISQPVVWATVGAANQQYAYVGTKKCKMCHPKQHKGWKKSKKSKSLEPLMSGNFADLKKKHNLDPDKDYTRDSKCLKCHTTGFGLTGGYFIPDLSDAKAVKKAKKLAGVGCESCHGAGSEYVKLHKEIMMSKRKYSVDEMYAAGMYKIEESVCLQCHNEDNPAFDPSKPFIFEERKLIGAHEHYPLKQRRK